MKEKNTILTISIIVVLILVGYFAFKNTNNEEKNINVDKIQENTELTMELQINTTREGDGEEIQNGQTAVVNYTGTLDDGTVFDSSIPRGEPFSFILGAGQVIEGWDKGVLGMKVGGTRILIIPSDLAYGDGGRGPIPPGATLTFEVELVEIR